MPLPSPRSGTLPLSVPFPAWFWDVTPRVLFWDASSHTLTLDTLFFFLFFWFVFFFFFLCSPLTALLLSTGALGHPLSLANASGGPFHLKSAPTAPLVTWCSPGSFYSFFFSFAADPLPFSHRCTSGTPLACKREWGSPFLRTRTCRPLLLTNTRCDAEASWFVFFFFYFLIC